MNKEKALKILGLSGNPSEEEIKKAYRKLSIEHHPDYHMGESETVRLEHEEKMKDINAAYAYFNKFNVYNYQREIIDKMISYYIRTSAGNFEIVREDVKKVAEKYISFTYHESNKNGLDMILKKFLEELKRVYSVYEFLFYQENYIDKNEIKETINYNLNVEDFYNQLEHLKTKYGKEAKFKQRVEVEIAPYKLYATCTNRIWKLISEVSAKNALINARNASFKNDNEVIANMHKEIQDLFKLVDEINNKFNTINEELKNITNKELKQEYEELKNKNAEGYALDDIQKDLISLQNKIEEYKKEQIRLAKIKEEEPLVNKLYHKLVMSFNNALMSLNPIKDNDKIVELTDFYKLVMNSFFRYNVGLIDVDRLLMLDNLTFTDSLKDKELLNVVFSRKDTNTNKLKIYLKKGQFCNRLLDDYSFFVLKEKDSKYYMQKISIKECSEEEILPETVEREYISLDELMKSTIYQGYKVMFAGEVQNLYEIEGYRNIILENGKIEIVNRGWLSKPIAACSDEYKDKDYFMEMLEKQIKNTLAENRTR